MKNFNDAAKCIADDAVQYALQNAIVLEHTRECIQ